MVTVRYGGKEGRAYTLDYSEQLVAVRTVARDSLERTPLSPGAQESLIGLDVEAQFREAGVEVLTAGSTPRRDSVRAALKAEASVRFAGRVLVGEDGVEPVLYTENLFVRFAREVTREDAHGIFRDAGLQVKRELRYASNAYFVEATEGIGLEIFDIAERLLDQDAVDLCHPELIRKVRRRLAFPMQWHLGPTTINGKNIVAHANVEAAWQLTRGEGTVIAIIDDGVDIGHPEFARPNKVVFPRDALFNTSDPRPGQGNNHGTACAGVACADGLDGASGVAPAAKLMPIRMVADLGSQAEAEAFAWAADHGADVISCSWGPQDGNPRNPNDPLHFRTVPLPDSTRLAIDYATNQGREGRGCVVFFAAGNGNEDVGRDGYASYPRVTAVAACNDRGTRSFYSDFGDAVWCAFPSSDPIPASQVPGIWTTDRRGHDGYNFGSASRGDAAGDYTNSFGGTSSACPGAAGVAALVIARNPELRWDQVKEILKRACDQIDPAGGGYDATGHSKLYGFGRLDARRAVDLAGPPQPAPTAIFAVRQDVPIPDLGTAMLSVDVADARAVKALRVAVDIRHTYRGDLVVTLMPPAGAGNPVVLHDRAGGSSDDLVLVYDSLRVPALGQFTNRSAQGKWSLEVRDRAARDIGTLKKLELQIDF
ncbi:MAG: S8 family serine peptidase [Dehalococcoidia bacterium]